MQSRLNFLWEYILSKHPKTKDIFLEKKGFDIKHKTTYLKLIKEISKIDFSLISCKWNIETFKNSLSSYTEGYGEPITFNILDKVLGINPNITYSKNS